MKAINYRKKMILHKDYGKVEKITWYFKFWFIKFDLWSYPQSIEAEKQYQINKEVEQVTGFQRWLDKNQKSPINNTQFNEFQMDRLINTRI